MGTPVIVVAGFLGSGKTTLLNHVLHNRASVRVGVVVNDFGAINVDAMALSAQVDTMMAFGNGCLCCAIDAEDMGDTLRGLGEADVDVIIVEPSGLAEPHSVVRLVLASADERLSYGGLLEVVDAAEFRATRERHPEFARHLGLADLVVLNKTDLVGEDELAAVRAEINELAGPVPVLTTSHGAIDPRVLFDSADDDQPRQLSFDELDHDHSAHAHHRYQTCTVSTGAMDPLRLMEFLRTREANLFRIKGNVCFDVPGYEEKFVLHTVGRHLRFTPEPWRADEPRRTELVLIGDGIDTAEVTRRLRDCAAETERTEHDLLEVLRYAR